MPSKLKEMLENGQFEVNNAGDIVIYGDEPVARIMRELDTMKARDRLNITYHHHRDANNNRFITISAKNINIILNKKENRPVKRDNDNNPTQIKNYTQLVQAKANAILSSINDNLMIGLWTTGVH